MISLARSAAIAALVTISTSAFAASPGSPNFVGPISPIGAPPGFTGGVGTAGNYGSNLGESRALNQSISNTGAEKTQPVGNPGGSSCYTPPMAIWNCTGFQHHWDAASCTCVSN
jgi:hypothetical protein